MFCLKCKNEQFTEKHVDVLQTFRCEDFTVKAPAMVCTECGLFAMSEAQSGNLCVFTADEFRRRHGLLTSAEIVARRTSLGMSQRKFANFIEVGEASVKRWEKGYVQEKIYDDWIRRKCAGAIRRTRWEIVHSAARSDYGIRVHTFHVTTAVGIREETLTLKTDACATSSRVTFVADLSDGHPWRAEHFAVNDPALSTSA